jgi:hypothetical protein
MEIDIKSFDPASQEVHFTTPDGASLSARWGHSDAPDIGSMSVEFESGPTCVWRRDVAFVSTNQPDAIVRDAEGYLFIGEVESVPEDDRRDGIFYLRTFGSLIMLDADEVAANAVGSRVRVRQQHLAVLPERL